MKQYCLLEIRDDAKQQFVTALFLQAYELSNIMIQVTLLDHEVQKTSLNGPLVASMINGHIC